MIAIVNGKNRENCEFFAITKISTLKLLSVRDDYTPLSLDFKAPQFGGQNK